MHLNILQEIVHHIASKLNPGELFISQQSHDLKRAEEKKRKSGYAPTVIISKHDSVCHLWVKIKGSLKKA